MFQSANESMSEGDIIIIEVLLIVFAEIAATRRVSMSKPVISRNVHFQRL